MRIAGGPMRKAFCGALLSVAVCAAQSPPEDTGGLLNGRLWMEAAPLQRSMYIWGVWDALAVTHSQAGEFGAPGFNGAETSKCIDQFFGDSANIQVPIVQAMVICARKFKGASSVEIESLTIDARRRAMVNRVQHSSK